MTLPRFHRRLGVVLALAVWLFALACTSAYACELGVPLQQHDCCAATTSIDAQCSAHCELEGQAPGHAWPDFGQLALLVPALRAPAHIAAIRAHPPPDARGASLPLTILLLRLRN